MIPGYHPPNQLKLLVFSLADTPTHNTTMQIYIYAVLSHCGNITVYIAQYHDQQSAKFARMTHHIPMPPIPPIPPPPPGIASSFLGISVIVTSAVVNSDATPAASCSEERTTLAGSMIPVGGWVFVYTCACE